MSIWNGAFNMNFRAHRHGRRVAMAGKEKFMENPSKENLSDRFIHLATSLEDFCPRRTALRISSVYVIIGVLWILLSDKILDWLLSDQRLITMISMLKGWVYVLVTGTLLFLLILSSLNKILSINRTLLKNYEELAAVYEELAASEQELQKQIEMLAESEERYRLVSEATNDGIWDEKQGERYFSERWYEIMGYSRDELTEIKDWMSLIHPEDIDMVRQKISWHKQNRDPNYRCEYRLKHKNGEYRWILSRARLIFDAHGEIVRSAGSHTDITDIQLMQQDFTDKLMEILAQTGMHPEYLELEVTESVIIESYEVIKNKLEDLISKGIKVALDDFGKGYSSLSYLTQIPITTLKIDKSFVDTIGSGRFDRSLTSMIIMIGRRLGLSVVAEGVETEEQLEYLKKHKCHKVQGYYFSKPLPYKKILDLLDKNKGVGRDPAGN
ncbi:EAL domain-containing protein [Candidatus Parcubacteria bacterium]|nr:MAG: EAL domain-containing protein [Candidatus Parcubacteria bacterium]